MDMWPRSGANYGWGKSVRFMLRIAGGFGSAASIDATEFTPTQKAAIEAAV